MNTKIKQKFFIFFLISQLICIVSGCNNDKEELPEPLPEPLPEVLVPCNYDPGDREVIEIKDFRTKLYYQVPWPEGIVRPDCATEPKGITYSDLKELMEVRYFDPEVHYPAQDTAFSFCNFPEYVVNWNPRNKETERKECILVEGEVDIILSGKLYVNHRSETQLSGEMELTSLQRITP